MALGDYMKVSCHGCIGGTNVRHDMHVLREGVQVVVGTPGRVKDMITRNALNPSFIKLFVLDEADEMLSRGFKDQIYEVFQYMPDSTQVDNMVLLTLEALAATCQPMKCNVFIYRWFCCQLQCLRKYWMSPKNS